jgi:hypothetical protein
MGIFLFICACGCTGCTVGSVREGWGMGFILRPLAVVLTSFLRVAQHAVHSCTHVFADPTLFSTGPGLLAF